MPSHWRKTFTKVFLIKTCSAINLCLTRHHVNGLSYILLVSTGWGRLCVKRSTPLYPAQDQLDPVFSTSYLNLSAAILEQHPPIPSSRRVLYRILTIRPQRCQAVWFSPPMKILSSQNTSMSNTSPSFLANPFSTGGIQALRGEPVFRLLRASRNS